MDFDSEGAGNQTNFYMTLLNRTPFHKVSRDKIKVYSSEIFSFALAISSMRWSLKMACYSVDPEGPTKSCKSRGSSQRGVKMAVQADSELTSSHRHTNSQLLWEQLPLREHWKLDKKKPPTRDSPDRWKRRKFLSGEKKPPLGAAVLHGQPAAILRYAAIPGGGWDLRGGMLPL